MARSERTAGRPPARDIVTVDGASPTRAAALAGEPGGAAPPAGAATRATVALVHGWVGQFRSGFYDALRDDLAGRGIALTVLHGFPRGEDVDKEDAIAVPGAEHVRNRVIRIGGRELIWQPLTRRVARADLVVITQQSKLLLTYVLLARQLLGRQRMALWGHGRNLDEAASSRVGESVKRFVSRRVHWWFAYNDLSARHVQSLGFPAERTTSVGNAIDTTALRAADATLTDAELDALRTELGIASSNVCLYVGGMYDLKRIPYLLEACDALRQRVPDFEMLFLGGGPERPLVERAADSRPWMHVLGPTFDRDKARLFRLAALTLIPGRVGLAIVDTFALATPLVTLADSTHSPEIDYLEPGVNGVLLPAGTRPDGYAAAVAELLADRERRADLVIGARDAGDRHSIEAMAARFADGISQALETM